MHRARDYFDLRPLWARAAVALAAVAAAAVAALAGAAPARAAAVPALFAVTVPEADAQRAVQLAMRAVLVRVTGTRDAATDPALGAVVDDAAHYVRLQRATTGGATQVIFDDLNLRAAVRAAGRNVWDLDRPTLQVWLPAADDATLDALRTQLAGVAQERGLPLLFSTEAAAADDAEALAAARRTGADAALLARPAPESPGAWQWTLVAPEASGQWVGSAATGIDEATDALVRTAATLQAAPVEMIECRVTGVTDLGGFSAVFEAMRSTPGVTAVHVRSIDGDALSLELTAHGGPALLAHALSSDRLRPLEPGEQGVLAYRYQAAP